MMARAPVEPLALLSELLIEGGQRFAAEAYGGRFGPAITALVGAGIVVHDGVLDTVICNECDMPHPVDVVTCGPDDGYGWHCPEAGFVAAAPDALIALSIEMDRVVAALGEAFIAAFGVRRWTSRPLDEGNAWIVGVWEIGGTWTTVVLARGLDSTARARQTACALAALPPNDAGLVLTVGEENDFESPPRFAVVPLTAALILTADGDLRVDGRMLARAVAPHATASLVAHAGRPSVKTMVFAVLDSLMPDDLRNNESEMNARILARAWPDTYPGEKPPSQATLRRHLASWRVFRRAQGVS